MGKTIISIGGLMFFGPLIAMVIIASAGEVPLLVTSLGATSTALGVITTAAGAVLTAYGG